MALLARGVWRQTTFCRSLIVLKILANDKDYLGWCGGSTNIFQVCTKEVLFGSNLRCFCHAEIINICSGIHVILVQGRNLISDFQNTSISQYWLRVFASADIHGGERNENLLLSWRLTLLPSLHWWFKCPIILIINYSDNLKHYYDPWGSVTNPRACLWGERARFGNGKISKTQVLRLRPFLEWSRWLVRLTPCPLLLEMMLNDPQEQGGLWNGQYLTPHIFRLCFKLSLILMFCFSQATKELEAWVAMNEGNLTHPRSRISTRSRSTFSIIFIVICFFFASTIIGWYHSMKQTLIFYLRQTSGLDSSSASGNLSPSLLKSYQDDFRLGNWPIPW